MASIYKLLTLDYTSTIQLLVAHVSFTYMPKCELLYN